jgi:hypothetical protein
MSLGGQCVLQKKLLTANGAMATQQFLREKMEGYCRRRICWIWARWASPFKNT